MPNPSLGYCLRVTEAPLLHPSDADETSSGTPQRLDYAVFGEQFLRRVLHLDRILECIDRALGDEIRLGPMGAGPGRKIAKVTAHGTFGASRGREVPGDSIRYAVEVPIDVDFHLDLPLDSMTFHAQVTIPLGITVHMEEPLVIVWDVVPPTEDEVVLDLSTDTRRSAVLQKLAGLEGELRRFIIRFIERELTKPHIQRATHIDLPAIIDGAWPYLAQQFLPNSPEDRTR